MQKMRSKSYGADGGDRTHDLFITNEVRLPLCYISVKLDAPQGFEPRFTVPKTVVLPLYEGAASKASVIIYRLINVVKYFGSL